MMIKKYLGKNVYDMAKERIGYILDQFDNYAVLFSGGKDSLVTLHLFQEVWDKAGRSGKVNVIFKDEELIPDEVIEFVQSYYKSGRFNFYYYAVPMRSQKYVMGKTTEYIQWDPNRTWIRPKPDFAIKDIDGKIFDQYTMDEEFGKLFKGKIALVNGIRAEESLNRQASILVKKDLCYISASGWTVNSNINENIFMAKPIYDWLERDIFKYLYDNKIRYCSIYDNQLWNRSHRRVSTPLHPETAKYFHKLKTLYPIFYQQIINIFPEMLIQDRYGRNFDQYGPIDKYPHTWEGIIQYVNENITVPAMRHLSMKRILQCKRARENALKNGRSNNRFGGYPLLYVFRRITEGRIKRAFQPVSNRKLTKAMEEYECPSDK